MVEPLFFADIGAGIKEGSSFTLSGSEAKHAVSVRRMAVGEKISISDGVKFRIRGVVSRVDKNSLELEIKLVESLEAPQVKLYLVQALAKGDRDELAVQACTELGVFGVIPWQADRSVSVWKDDKKAKGQARWQTIAAEAAKQSLHPLIPVVQPVQDSRGLIGALSSFDQVLVLNPLAESSIVKQDFPSHGSIAILVGPEGGLSDEEIELFSRAGFTGVHLGDGILRTSTAGVAAASYLQAKLGDWN